tara:strand:- start:8270 stop:8974 length:705 start_codon:yes stop_codon:yes gene_type:complete
VTVSLAIMQPYFLPYIGYFQLIAAVNEFVIYDNIKYTKKGWINRNRFLLNGKDAFFTLPLLKASDDLDVVERELATAFNRKKLLNQLRGAYAKAPQFDEVFPLLERVVEYPDDNLFRYIHHSVTELCAFIGIKTPIVVSSTVDIDHSLKAQDKVLALCKARGAGTYINPIGGTELYDRDVFAANGIDLKFHRARPFEYSQFQNEFVPWLSVVDVLMFNPLDGVQDVVFNNFELV